jgi:hypothetical protein
MNFRFVFWYKWSCRLQGQRMHKKEDSYECGRIVRVCCKYQICVWYRWSCRLLKEAIAAGCSVIYLEKPGAPTVAELEEMKKTADNAGVKVLMGCNKNVAKYVANTREFASKTQGEMSNHRHNNNK